jgi:putative transcriptional regulator
MIQLRIENILDERELSLYWLAKQTGIDYAVLWKLTHGKMRGFPFEYIDLICEALDCQPGDLMTRAPGGVKKSASKGTMKRQHLPIRRSNFKRS